MMNMLNPRLIIRSRFDEDEGLPSPLVPTLPGEGDGGVAFGAAPITAPRNFSVPPVAIMPPTPQAAPIMAVQPKAQPEPTVPQAAPILSPRIQADQDNYDRLKNSKPGVDQYLAKPGIGHKILGVLGKIGDVAGSFMFPSIAANIPGTTLHHDALENQAHGQLDADIAADSAQAETREKIAKAAQESAKAAAMLNPPPKEQKIEPMFDKAGNLLGFRSDENELIGPNSPKLTADMRDMLAASQPKGPVQHLATDQGYFVIHPDGKVEPMTFNGQPLKPEAKQPTSDVATYARDYLAANKLEDTPANRLKAHQAFTKETKTDPGVTRMQVLVDGRPVQVVDPNDPGVTRYARAGNAVASGAAAPGSAAHVAANATARDAAVGDIGKSFRYFDTAEQHLQTLEKAGKALKNGDVRALNSLANNWGVATGQSAPATYNAIQQVIAGEINKAIAGTGSVAEGEMNLVRSLTDASLSPAQRAGVVAGIRELMRGKKQALQQQTDRGSGRAGTQSGGAAEEYVRDPKTRKLVKK